MQQAVIARRRENRLALKSSKGRTMEIVIALLVVAGWFLLQAWLLPRFGLKT